MLAAPNRVNLNAIITREGFTPCDLYGWETERQIAACSLETTDGTSASSPKIVVHIDKRTCKVYVNNRAI